ARNSTLRERRTSRNTCGKATPSEKGPSMRTFEFIEGSSKKFWNIELDGNKTIVTFGRIGTKGQTKTKEHASAAAAQKEYDKLIKEKLGKGYTETTPAAAEGPTPAVTRPAAGVKEALEVALVPNT